MIKQEGDEEEQEEEPALGLRDKLMLLLLLISAELLLAHAHTTVEACVSDTHAHAHCGMADNAEVVDEKEPPERHEHMGVLCAVDVRETVVTVETAESSCSSDMGTVRVHMG